MLTSILGAHGSFGDVVPALAVLVGVTVALDLAQAVEAEQSRLLGELVGRSAMERVIDVGVYVDLLAFEKPDFYDRLRRAQAQGMWRAMQTGERPARHRRGCVAAVAIVGALAGLEPLLVPVVVLGYVPLWIASSRNSGDFYEVNCGMTPKDRQRYYLQHLLLDRNEAKELRAFKLVPYLRGSTTGSTTSGSRSCGVSRDVVRYDRWRRRSRLLRSRRWRSAGSRGSTSRDA